MTFIFRNGDGAMGRKPWLRINRVAKILDCRREYVYELIRNGKLEAVRIGPRNIRVAEESLDQLLERSRIGPDDI